MQEILQTLPVWAFALTLFTLRVVDMSIGTLRIMVSMRGNRWLSWILGFIQSIIFVLAITSVLNSLDNILNIIAYAAGYATGGVVGMWLEGKLAIGYTHIQITSSRRGAALAETLRSEGFGVTEISARGKDGMVSMLSCNVRRKRVSLVEEIVRKADEDAFITSEDVRPIRRGFWRA